MKSILYLDCDGVILDTMDTAYKMMDELGLDGSDYDTAHDFFVNTDWYTLVYESGFINNAIIKIKNLINSGLFEKIIILTKICGNEDEEKIKRILFGKLLPMVEVITVPLLENKDEIVDPVNNILVEDSTENAVRWEQAGGVGIYFKKDIIDYENNVINDLEDVPKTKNVKCLLKKIKG